MKVLVYGSGQLAQMMYLAAVPLGIDVQAVDVKTEQVVHPVDKRSLDITLQRAIDDADAITVEFEHVPEPLLLQADKSGKLFPNLTSILAGADRVREKALLDGVGIPNCEHEIISCTSDLTGIINRLGDRIIFKSSRDGYDGYGQWRLTQADDLEKLEEIFAELDLKKVPLVAEKMVDFDREISIIGARNAQGDIECFDIAENLHHQGQLHVSVAPALRLNDSLRQSAKEIFEKLANALDYVGVLAVELFQCSDKLLVNEIAPRVHNSGHWTQQGCETSQFEQHVRAVLGLPLGSTNLLNVSSMVNVIGCSSFSRDLIGLEGCHLHWYGKEVREKRKMGHINVIAESHSELGAKLDILSQFLPTEHFPLLKDEATRLQRS